MTWKKIKINKSVGCVTKGNSVAQRTSFTQRGLQRDRKTEDIENNGRVLKIYLRETKKIQQVYGKVFRFFKEN